jgi:hypothetical protein
MRLMSDAYCLQMSEQYRLGLIAMPDGSNELL